MTENSVTFIDTLMTYPDFSVLDFLVKNYRGSTFVIFAPSVRMYMLFSDYLAHEYLKEDVAMVIGHKLMSRLPETVENMLTDSPNPVVYLIDNKKYGYNILDTNYKFGQWYESAIKPLVREQDVVFVYGESKYD